MGDYYDFFVKYDNSILEALQKADETEKEVLLVTKHSDLMGYIPDLVLRRLAIDRNNLTKKIGDFANLDIEVIENGKLSDKQVDGNVALLILKDSENNIKQIQFKEEKFKIGLKNLSEVPVVIMAGGLGTRLRPFTEIIPKPLFPVGNKAILEIIINKFREYKVQDFYLTLYYKSAFIKAFMNEIAKDYNVFYIDEEKPLGTAGSLKYLEKKFDKPFIVSNCDIVINTSYLKLYDFHIKNNFDLTLVGALQEYQVPYGVCEINSDFELLQIHEKPKNYFIINTGMYVLNPDILELIPKGEFYHITDLMNDVKKNGGRVGVFPISQDSWIDIGTLEEFKKNVSKLFELK